MSAILELKETPQSCKDCDLWHYCLNYLKITIFKNKKNPDCPLKITETLEPESVNNNKCEYIDFIYDVNKMRNCQKIGHDINKRIRLEKKVDKYLTILIGDTDEKPIKTIRKRER